MVGIGTLENWEARLIMGMHARGDMTDQQILAYFTRPGRDLNHTVVPRVAWTYPYSTLTVATPAEVDDFVSLRRRLDPKALSTARAAVATYRPAFGYTFHPVGQGLFTSGWVTREHGLPFRWIYDCGTSKRRNRRRVLRGLATLRAESDPVTRRGGHVDLLTVSHFDTDHISGLLDLLDRFSVGTLVLPYIAPWDRLVIALEEGAAQGSDVLSFLMAPTAFLLARSGARISRIVLVPPSDAPAVEPGPAMPTDPDEGRLRLKVDEIKPEPEADEGGGADDGLKDSRVCKLVPGGAMTVPGLWEFVPFNDPGLAGLADEAFRDQARDDAERLRASDKDSERADALADLKALYDARFGSDDVRRNIITLYQYAGPLGRVALVSGSERVTRHRLFGWRIGAFDAEEDRFGQMMTGDGFLETKARSDEFVRFFRSHGRLKRGGIFQVMHHGSRRNWRKGLAGRIRPLRSVFSSNPHGEYRHPHLEVVKDFASCGVRQVDLQNGWSVCGEFVFL